VEREKKKQQGKREEKHEDEGVKIKLVGMYLAEAGENRILSEHIPCPVTEAS